MIRARKNVFPLLLRHARVQHTVRHRSTSKNTNHFMYDTHENTRTHANHTNNRNFKLSPCTLRSGEQGRRTVKSARKHNLGYIILLTYHCLSVTQHGQCHVTISVSVKCQWNSGKTCRTFPPGATGMQACAASARASPALRMDTTQTLVSSTKTLEKEARVGVVMNCREDSRHAIPWCVFIKIKKKTQC